MTNRRNYFLILGAIMLLVAIMNLNIAFNDRITSLNYFGYEIRISSGYRIMCLFGGISMSLIFLTMVIGSIVEKIKKNRAHSICHMTETEWDNFCKVSPELKEKAEKADSISLEELEHLSDKKD